MSTTGTSCNNCGRELQGGDRFCPACGAPQEQVEQKRPAATLTETVCDVCGHVNKHDGAYCESCGVKLRGRSSKSVPRSKAESGARTDASTALRPWHYLVAALVLGIAGTFIYLEATRQTGTQPAAGTPPQIPSTQQAPAPPSKELLQAIDHFEHLISDNPNDVGAKLKLANSLHDASLSDPTYLTRAIDAYKQYLQQMPKDPNARVDLGICYFELGKIDTARAASLFAIAINEMETAVKNSPNHQAGAFNLGIVNLYAGNLQASNNWLKKAAELNPDSELGRRAKSIVEQHMQAQ